MHRLAGLPMGGYHVSIDRHRRLKLGYLLSVGHRLGLTRRLRRHGNRLMRTLNTVDPHVDGLDLFATDILIRRCCGMVRRSTQTAAAHALQQRVSLSKLSHAQSWMNFRFYARLRTIVKQHCLSSQADKRCCLSERTRTMRCSSSFALFRSENIESRRRPRKEKNKRLTKNKPGVLSLLSYILFTYTYSDTPSSTSPTATVAFILFLCRPQIRSQPRDSFIGRYRCRSTQFVILA